MEKEALAKIIDHTLLSPTATKSQIEKLCDEAAQNKFASVCVNPIWVKFCAEKLRGTGVAVCTVIGFPLGADKTEVKTFATSSAVLDGADEIDMVLNVGKAKEGDFEFVQDEIEQVVNAAKSAGEANGKKVLVKVILETCLLTDIEIEKCCLAAKSARADFVKTSTGFAAPKDKKGEPLPNGASVHHIALMRKTVGSALGVKASGGIRTAQFAQELVEAGATRLGTSNGIAIIAECLNLPQR
ncbi:MAG: deoxyribose-phosphate aldolase [Treponema sp.]|nr:deoxyribose-phosphate aldolase [Treponema sp.]